MSMGWKLELNYMTNLFVYFKISSAGSWLCESLVVAHYDLKKKLFIKYINFIYLYL